MVVADELGETVREFVGGCLLLGQVAREAEQRHGSLGQFTADEWTLWATCSSARNRWP